MDKVTKLKDELERQTLLAQFSHIAKNDFLWQSKTGTALKFLLSELCDLLPIQSASLWLTQDDQSGLYCEILHNKNRFSLINQSAINQQENPRFFSLLEDEGLLVFEGNTLSHNPTNRDHKFTSAVVAIRHKGKLSGAASFIHETNQTGWSEEEKHVLLTAVSTIDQIIFNQNLFESEQLYHTLFNNLGDACFIIIENYFVDCNPAALTMFGCKQEQLIGQTPYKFSPLRQPCGTLSSEKAMGKISHAFNGETQFYTWQHLRCDGTLFDAEVTLSSVAINEVPHILASIRDISDRTQREARIHSMHALQQAIFDGASYGIIATSLTGTIKSFNKAAENMLGYCAHEVIGHTSFETFHDPIEMSQKASQICSTSDDFLQPGFDVFIHRAQLGNTDEQEWTFITQDGARFPGLLSIAPLKTNQQITGYLAIISNITEKKRAEADLLRSKQEMEYRANHDSLTGLPNRSRLHECASTAIQLAGLQNHKAALLLLDLDRFKEVNDTLGHYAGDLLLQKLAKRLRKVLAKNHSQLYRLGGDEFAILTPVIKNIADAQNIGDIINDSLHRPIEIEGVTLELGGSIGIACYPDHGENSDSLLRCADVAMYRAKSSASEPIIYDARLDSHTPRRLAIMSELGKAIREDQLVLYFQPRVCLITQQCVGCEALIRWQHPQLGLIEPEEFIPLAEMSDLIRPLSMWVLRTALHNLKRWIQQGVDISVSVNVSARNLLDIHYPDYIQQLLHEYQIPPHMLDIEITESAIISDPERSLKVVDRIHELGVSLAIDDFGTGYSSLSYLKRLPIQLLKIDRTFIQDLIHDEQDAAIVRSTIGLAHSFDLQVVAEGVEDKETLTELEKLGCEYGQGYFFKYPLPADVFEKWLRIQNFEEALA